VIDKNRQEQFAASCFNLFFNFEQTGHSTVPRSELIVLWKCWKCNTGKDISLFGNGLFSRLHMCEHWIGHVFVVSSYVAFMLFCHFYSCSGHNDSNELCTLSHTSVTATAEPSAVSLYWFSPN